MPMAWCKSCDDVQRCHSAGTCIKQRAEMDAEAARRPALVTEPETCCECGAPIGPDGQYGPDDEAFCQWLVDEVSVNPPLGEPVELRQWLRRNWIPSPDTKAATPEPPPLASGEPVTPYLMGWVERNVWPDDLRDRLLADVKARDAFGRKKYGQPLMTGDGRDTANDAAQELYDFMQYATKAALNGEDLSDVRRLYGICGALLKAIDDGIIGRL